MSQGFFGRLSQSASTFTERIRTRFYPLDILIRAGQQYSQDNGTTYAAAMSYYVLFSLFPTMIFFVVVFGLVVRDPELQTRAVDTIVELVPAGFDVRSQIQSVIEELSAASSPIIAVLSLIGTAWTASGMFAALRIALNRAFNIPHGRNFVIGRLMDMLNLPAIMILVIISIAATAALQFAEGFFRRYLPGDTLTTVSWNLAYFLLPYLISFLVFTIVYRVIPNHRLPFRIVMIGAAIAAIGFELAKLGFTFYVANFGRYQEVYGTLGGVVAFLFFVFIVANIVIFSAEIASEVAKDYANPHRATTGNDPASA